MQGDVVRIARVQTFVVEQRLEQPFYFSQWEYDRRAICLVKITADDGSYGWGEGYGPANVVAAGVEYLSQYVLGKDPLHEGALWQEMHRRSQDYARRGILVASLSAIDIALWDLKGKLVGQPASVLLGGRRREAVQVYATGMYFTRGPDQPRRLALEAVGYAQQGYRAMKMKVGLGLETDMQNVRAVRKAIGPEVRLMVDANHAYARSEALALCRQLEPLDIGWFEEPISPEDYAGYHELRLRTTAPIAAGECEYLTVGFRHLVAGQCVDIAQPDICAAGGLTEARRIVALANAFEVNVTPHCWGTGIAFAAALHLTSTLDVLPGRMLGAEPILEMDRSENPLRDKLTVPRFQVRDGCVEVPEEPGLGVDVDPELLRQYAVHA